jgi:hypothetical protein
MEMLMMVYIKLNFLSLSQGAIPTDDHDFGITLASLLKTTCNISEKQLAE